MLVNGNPSRKSAYPCPASDPCEAEAAVTTVRNVAGVTRLGLVLATELEYVAALVPREIVGITPVMIVLPLAAGLRTHRRIASDDHIGEALGAIAFRVDTL